MHGLAIVPGVAGMWFCRVICQMLIRMLHYLEFEKPIADIDAQIAEIKADISEDNRKEREREVARLKKNSNRLMRDLYKNLTPIRACKVARHPDRPHCTDYVRELFSETNLLAGDRGFADDQAVLCYLARFHDEPVVVIGHEKGSDTKSRIVHNFGMARPEGYRKAIRLIDIADRFCLPVICLVDTPGAYPGLGAEERGQSEAIARTIEKSLSSSVPIISVITGEGGSGGAVAFATSDRIAMLEHSIYSVISPEGCASILWKDAEMKHQAADALRLTASDMVELGVVDKVIKEPLGGAHRDRESAIESVGKAIEELLGQLSGKRPDSLLRERHKKFLNMYIPQRKRKRPRLKLH